ncbi:rhodanese-like domain-containing protein [Paenibacillus barcinonensis]|uniref:Rhodanese-like domain-containing protein n=1 Tax=Paenibacillus barcinonensis TaxID=198119 RepID=A0A2V4VGW4_PAEBA|nr:rhodanese-like domain-containing protein [Paenibacillus barcinonensis]PYE45432.1 rhodanese-related sulfurtransferase [Paenibacillus barcinonensis]QKS55248.1 rhodanese-like domain-containing protein [Paenibacillus barcinonensis]
MTLVYITAGAGILWLIVQLWPVSSLTYVSRKEWDPSHKRWSDVRMLDVRDSSEFWQNHIPGSINISIGRLSAVWSKELSPDQEVIIFSRNWLSRQKAARILARRGFKQLYAVKGCYFDINRKGESCERKYCY